MNKGDPKITVIVPTFNRANYIGECLDSLLEQTIPPHQIIVVNDGSTDETEIILEQYLSKVEYLETAHEGKSVAINQALKIVTGDYVWIFDDDDVALPDALERFVVPLENHPEYDYSFSSFYFTESNEDHTIGRIRNEFKIPDLSEQGPLIPLLIFNYLGGAALFARRTVYDEVGTFDESLLRSQDYEMAIRIVRNFNGFHVKGKPTFHYRQHHGDRGNFEDRFKIAYRNKKWQDYDQNFFRDFYDELELSEYLPPDTNLKNHRRQAYIQRMAVMGSKNLLDLVLKDLRKISSMDDRSGLNAHEKKALQILMNLRRGPKCDTIYDEKTFFDEIKTLSESEVVKNIRSSLGTIIWRRCKTKDLKEVPVRINKAFKRTSWMYIGL